MSEINEVKRAVMALMALKGQAIVERVGDTELLHERKSVIVHDVNLLAPDGRRYGIGRTNDHSLTANSYAGIAKVTTDAHLIAMDRLIENATAEQIMDAIPIEGVTRILISRNANEDFFRLHKEGLDCVLMVNEQYKTVGEVEKAAQALATRCGGVPVAWMTTLDGQRKAH